MIDEFVWHIPSDDEMALTKPALILCPRDGASIPANRGGPHARYVILLRRCYLSSDCPRPPSSVKLMSDYLEIADTNFSVNLG
ncbi:hypothetical protein CC2G_002047 [Coprinopsis cinerea AmutBmut pab1-1]|nr:hypothetical protein CC2G_002047 [Coprinopsis cinerea AmutBmut pab1-1]